MLAPLARLAGLVRSDAERRASSVRLPSYWPGPPYGLILPSSGSCGGRGVTVIAGVDEVGVGAFAGPVVAAAVILAAGTVIDGLADSKLLSAKRRANLFTIISGCALAIGIGRTEVEEVDRLNIYWAAMEARRRVVERYPNTGSYLG